MKKIFLAFFFLSALFFRGQAQVEDVSVIVSPTLGYNWFDSKSTIDNGWMYGFQAGFGFGRFLELRGVYERSLDLKQQFGKYEGDLQQHFPDFNLKNRDVKVTRVGGEFKANISPTGLAPYLILGTGVQTFERTLSDNQVYKSKYLYGTGGIGIKINMGDRATLNLEGRGVSYKMNPGSLLYNPDGTSEFDDWINNQQKTRMYNWSATAGLQFYLGGRKSTELSALDREYLRRFSGGMSGAKLTLAPAGAYINFNNASPYRDTYLAGGILGLDLTNYVGLRGYYYQATNDKKIKLDFDKMSMYGVDFVGKLNVPRGIVPYITIGAGYLNVADDYKGKTIDEQAGTFQTASSGYFAKGGVGLEVPLGRNFDVFGAANLLYTMDNTDTKITDIRTTDQLRQHTMYNVGLRLKLGGKPNTQQAADRAFDRRFEEERNSYATERDLYNKRIEELEGELKEAYNNNDAEKATKIIEEKKALEQGDKKVDEDEGKKLIKLTPAELESLIEKVIKGVDNDSESGIENRLDRLENILLNINRTGRNDNYNTRNYSPEDTRALNDRLLDEIARLNEQLEVQKKNNEAMMLQNQEKKVEVTTVTTVPNERNAASDTYNNTHIETTGNGFIRSTKGMGAYIGGNIGDAGTFNIGVRSYHAIGRSRLMFMPEFYLALGEKTGAGLSGNIVLPFRLRQSSAFEPYIGAGLGLHGIGGVTRFNTNIIAGTAYQLGRGSAFADYSVRGLFKNNQLAVGYRFKF